MTIDEEFQKLIPPLTDDEYRQLEENCIKEGIREAILVWDRGDDLVIVDGHNRYKIAREHNLKWNHKVMNFESREAVKEWIILNQFGRRNLSAYDRSILALKLKPVIAEKAKERMLTAPHKKGERDKEIKKIWEKHDYDTAQNLVAIKKQEYSREDRAKIMASGKYIYFAKFNGNRIKVGSSVSPEDRVKQLSVSCPDIELIETVFYGEGAEKHENAIKKKYEQYRVGNECYQCPDEILKKMIAFTKKEAARKNNTDRELAKVAGVSHDTIHKVEKIEAEATPQVKEAVRQGKLSINQAYNSTFPKVLDPVREAKERHEAFQEKAKEDVVNFKEAMLDKYDQNIISHGFVRDLYRMGTAVKVFGLSHKKEEIEEQIAKLSEETIKNIIINIQTSIDELERTKKLLERRAK